MVRTLTQRWETLRTHPQGRWACLLIEALWYAALIIAVHQAWGTTELYFAYLGV